MKFDSYYGLPSDRIYVVRGGKALQKLFAMTSNDDFDYDAVLFSLRTLTEFFKAYEANPQECVDLYGGTPFEIWRDAQIGFLGGDEVHESFQSVYWLQTFLHGPFHLGLSATMLNADKFIERMQNTIYPKSIRFDKIKMKKYIQYVNLGYRLENPDRDKIKSSFPRRTTYAQAAYEGSIMKNRKVKTNMMTMFGEVIDKYYYRLRQPGDKFALYMARIDLINEVVVFLKAKYPQLDIRRYAEDDDYVNVIVPDGRVTTRGSAGTGVDIPNLTTVFSFDNVDSQQAALQLLGRLRELKDRDTLFVQMYATNIQKHVTYKNNRDKLFADRLKSVAETYYPGAL